MGLGVCPQIGRKGGVSAAPVSGVTDDNVHVQRRQGSCVHACALLSALSARCRRVLLLGGPCGLSLSCARVPSGLGATSVSTYPRLCVLRRPFVVRVGVPAPPCSSAGAIPVASSAASHTAPAGKQAERWPVLKEKQASEESNRTALNYPILSQLLTANAASTHQLLVPHTHRLRRRSRNVVCIPAAVRLLR